MAKKDLFSPTEIGGIRFKNPVLRAATGEFAFDEKGRPTENLVRMYENLAKGEVGGIITGLITSADGRSTHANSAMLDEDASIASYRQMLERVHEYGTPVIAQLAHFGCHGAEGKRFAVGHLKEDDIERIIADFVKMAIKAEKAGFDGVELHCAHGYMLSEFLSTRTNKRKDRWGGSSENRFRIVDEIMERIRAVLPDYPIFVKMNGSEKDGLTISEVVENAKRFEKAGVDALEISCGLQSEPFMIIRGKVPFDMMCEHYPGVRDMPGFAQNLLKPMLEKKMAAPEPIREYNLEAAKEIKKNVSIPVIAVGGIHDLHEIEEALDAGMDAVSMCRPLILEPNLVKKYKEGKQTEAKCLECNHCIIGLCTGSVKCHYGKVPKREG